MPFGNIAGYFGSQFAQNPNSITSLRNRFNQGLDQTGSYGNTANNAFLQSAMRFDPQEGLNRFATGAFNQFLPRLQESIGDLRGQQVSAGRFDSGFATQDEDRLVRGGLENLNNQLLQASLQAQGQGLQNQGQLANFGLANNNLYMNAVGGRLNTLEAQRLQDQASKRGFWGNVIGGGLGALGTIGGALIGGPAGAAAGGAIGSAVGGGGRPQQPSFPTDIFSGGYQPPGGYIPPNPYYQFAIGAPY